MEDDGNPAKNFSFGEESIQQWVNEIKNKTQPAIIPDTEIVRVHGKKIVEFSMKEFPIKPVSFKGRYFKRVKNSNHQLSLTEISDLHLKTFNTSWDSGRFNHQVQFSGFEIIHKFFHWGFVVEFFSGPVV